LERIGPSASNNLSSLSSSILLQLFPFALIIRKDLIIIGTGKQLKQMFCSGELIGLDLPSVARMRRPKLKPTWNNVCIVATLLLAE
jgi:guanylate cyclase